MIYYKIKYKFSTLFSSSNSLTYKTSFLLPYFLLLNEKLVSVKKLSELVFVGETISISNSLGFSNNKLSSYLSNSLILSLSNTSSIN